MLVQGLEHCCSLLHLHHVRTGYADNKNFSAHRQELLRVVEVYKRRSLVVVLGWGSPFDTTRKVLRSLARWRIGRGTKIYAKKLFTLPTTKGEVWIIVNP